MSRTSIDLRTPLLQQAQEAPQAVSSVYRPHSTWCALRIDITGQVAPCWFDKHELTQRYNLPNRDLRTVDPEAPILAPTTIFVREQALVVVLEALRCIIFKDHVLVLAVPGDSDGTGNMARSCSSVKAMQGSPFVQELSSKLQGRSHVSMSTLDAKEAGRGADPSSHSYLQRASLAENSARSLYSHYEPYLPPQQVGKLDNHSTPLVSRPSVTATNDSIDFEFNVLEVMLTLTIKALETETTALEKAARCAMQQLQQQVSKGALADIVQSKTHAVKLITRAMRYKQELERILQDNEEMAEMFLTKRSAMEGALGGPLASTLGTAKTTLLRVPTLDNDSRAAAAAAALLSGEDAVSSPPRAFVRTSTIRRPIRSPSLVPGSDWRATTSTPRQAAQQRDVPGPGASPAQQAEDPGSFTSDGRVDLRSRSFVTAASSVGADAAEGGRAPPDASPQTLLLASDELGQLALVQAIGEAEDMLEYYYMLVASVCSRVQAMRERIASVESSVQIEQDHRRNELVALELMVNSVTMAFGLVAMVAGVFGMNLTSGWETNPFAFWSVVAVSCVLGLFVCIAVGLYARYKRLLFISGMLGGEPRLQ